MLWKCMKHNLITGLSKNVNEYQRTWRKKLKNEAEALFSKKCYFCGKYFDVHAGMGFHKKDGNHGKQGNDTPIRVLRNPGEWVLLCKKCHRGVHFCYKYLHMAWDDIARINNEKTTSRA
jgi:hypothetical protein